MTPWSADTVRRTFIDFFVKKKQHVFVPSSPAVPLDDPTLMFTNAGMNQFKPIFLGQVDPASDMGRLRRAVNSQKCIRAGGKHNDLDDVGKDTYHHTFFEMLGNWSFGDYFKKEAVEWSWELLTQVFGLSPDRLYATYFEGDPVAGLPADEETRELWLKFLPESRVLPGNMKDNFWEMGDTGPCGPCTEIHYDRIGPIERGQFVPELVNSGDPDVLEIWNNVFIQYNSEWTSDGEERLREFDRTTPASVPPGTDYAKARDAALVAGFGTSSRHSYLAKCRTLRPLPAKHVDTGMGLERLVSVLQDKRSNYDTDVFMPLFAKIELLTNPPHAYTGRLGVHDVGNVDTAYRVIADHIRTLTFAITDGATPSNVGRGYVLRRILRRAVRYGRQVLHAKPGFLAALVPTVVERFGAFFPELKADSARVARIILEEEESFGKTLDRGIKLFEEVAAKGPIGAEDAFRLYDTFGFPIDLTEQMAEERKLKVDRPGYERLIEEAKERSRAVDTRDEAKALTLSGDEVARLRHLHIEPTDDSHKFEARDTSAHIKAIWNGANFDDAAKAEVRSHSIGIITDRTSFYAAMGGQEADTGKIALEAKTGGHVRPDHATFIVESVQAFGGYVLHIGHLKEGELRTGDTVRMHVDKARRARTQANHTATHLTNLGLRAVLGVGVDQKGSLVAPDRMRFDFSHGQPVSPEQLRRVEEIVQKAVKQDLTVYAVPASLGAAKMIRGLRAVFGEVYPDPVRVVSVGQPVDDLLGSPGNPAWEEVSVEFCGGTHVPSTAAIGAFAIVSEEAVAKGVRRVTALTGDLAAAANKAADEIERRIEAASRTSDAELPRLAQTLATDLEQAICPSWRKVALRAKIAAINERVKELGKQMGALVRDEAVKSARALAESALMANDMVVVGQVPAGEDRAALLAAVKTVRDKCPRAAVLLFSVDDGAGKVSCAASVPEPLIAKGLKAGDWIRDTSALIGGKGGGKPDSAQGGGTEVARVNEAISKARQQALKLVM